MKDRRCAIAILVFGIFISLSSCQLFFGKASQPQGTGSLMVQVSTSTAKTLIPAYDMAVKTYDIHGAGPAGAVFDASGFTGSTLSKTDLALGVWTISVNGKNEAGDTIVTGTGTATLELGIEASLVITLRPLAGTGSLSLSLSWTTGLFAVTSITGTLTSTSGSARTLAFSAGADGHSYTYTATDLDTGYHSLELTLLDGVETRWTMVETVRIVKDQETSAYYPIGSGDIYLGTVRRPDFTPAAGNYANAQSVSILCETPGAVIRYTNDGSVPTIYNGFEFTVPISLSSTTAIKARAFKAGWFDSFPVVSSYDIAGSVATPVAGVSSGLHYDPVSVALASATPGADIVYTIDDLTPPSSSHGTIFSSSSPIPINSDCTIRAVAISGEMTSDVMVSPFKITGHVADPVFSIPAGTYTSAQSVAITSTTTDATIYYTTDGTEPGQSSGTLYSGAVAITSSANLKAIAIKADWDSSPVTNVAYRISAVPPQSSVAAGIYNETKSIVLTSATSGAEIRYTTGDGSQAAPTSTTGTVFSTPIAVDQNMTIKAIARHAALDDSDAVSFGYELKPYPPTFDPLPGQYMDASVTVNLASATPGVSYLYTTGDGNQAAPTATSGNLGSSVSLGASGTIKAIAKKTGWSISDVTTATYSLNSLTIYPPNAGTISTATPTLQWPHIFNSVSYEIQIGDTQVVTESSVPIPCGQESYMVSSSLAINDAIFWRVRGIKADNSTTVWSATWHFKESYVDMIQIVGGIYTMRFIHLFPNDVVDCSVSVSDFSIGKFEITQAQYENITNATNPSSHLGDPELPVEMVSWYDAVEFCNLLSIKEGKLPAYSIVDRVPATGYPIGSASVTLDMSKSGYRLPTDAEWQWAARGGLLSHGYLNSGANDVSAVAWISSNSDGTTHPVGGKMPNELGIYDMSGNVFEFCWDWEYSNGFYTTYDPTGLMDPTGPSTGGSRMRRGGDVTCSGNLLNVENGYAPQCFGQFLGFRVVCRP
ncbi:MAG: hypothetical protein A2001_15510 [Treponema sp. GWC1_61_84]|nr:MAG: hypothetical protein A2001_15510 [Treponema sp. GWC1_61_84]